jgi:hypothetical protein
MYYQTIAKMTRTSFLSRWVLIILIKSTRLKVLSRNHQRTKGNTHSSRLAIFIQMNEEAFFLLASSVRPANTFTIFLWIETAYLLYSYPLNIVARKLPHFGATSGQPFPQTGNKRAKRRFKVPWATKCSTGSWIRISKVRSWRLNDKSLKIYVKVRSNVKTVKSKEKSLKSNKICEGNWKMAIVFDELQVKETKNRRSRNRWKFKVKSHKSSSQKSKIEWWISKL